MFLVDNIRHAVRVWMRLIARALNRISHGRIRPDQVTVLGTVMHLPVAALIAWGHYFWLAGGLLIIFGLFDTLDGEIARLQGSASAAGMLLDATTDRIKEVLLYIATAYYFAAGAHPRWSVLAVAACGFSLMVSYVKAKGEAAIAITKPKIKQDKLNRMFKDGLLTFDIRMLVMVLGLLSGQLVVAVGIIALLAAFTSIQRLIVIRSRL